MENDDQLTLAAFERESIEPTKWEGWISSVERLLGHSADGDQHIDHYSLDAFYQLYLEGSTPAEAIKEVTSIVY